MKEISYVVNNTLGIHARPAALLAQCCVNFKSQVRIYLDEKVADGDNVLQILALGAKKGDTLKLKLKVVEEYRYDNNVFENLDYCLNGMKLQEKNEYPNINDYLK